MELFLYGIFLMKKIKIKSLCLPDYKVIYFQGFHIEIYFHNWVNQNSPQNQYK